MKKTTLAVMCLAMLTGCAYTVPIKSNLRASTHIYAANKLPLKVGIFVDPALQDFTEVAKPSAYYGEMHSFTFSIGKALAPVLLKSSEVTFEKIEVINALPSRETLGQIKQFDGYLILNMADFNIDIFYVPGFFTSVGKAQCSITISINFLDNNLKSIFVSNIGGVGFGTKRGVFFIKGKDFSEAVEMAIQDVGDRLAQSLTTSGQLQSYAENRHEID